MKTNTQNALSTRSWAAGKREWARQHLYLTVLDCIRASNILSRQDAALALGRSWELLSGFAAVEGWGGKGALQRRLRPVGRSGGGLIRVGKQALQLPSSAH